MRLVTAPFDDLPDDLRRQADELTAAAWPGSPPGHDPALHPVTMVLVEPDGTVVATLDVLTVRIEHRSHGYRVAGLSAVTTRADRRRRGLGTDLARCAHDALAGRDTDTDVDLALFTSDPELVGVYERAGWQVLPGTSLLGGTRADPLDSAALGKRTLGGFFSPRARRHAADFVGAAVELYPGPIDRLF